MKVSIVALAALLAVYCSWAVAESPDPDACAALALARSHTIHKTICFCTSAADCDCGPNCICLTCNAADCKWVRYKDNDPRYAVLIAKDKSVGVWVFDKNQFLPFKDGKYLDACDPPVPAPEAIADVKAWPVQPTPVAPIYQPQQNYMQFQPQSFSMPMMGGFSGNCGSGG